MDKTIKIGIGKRRFTAIMADSVLKRMLGLMFRDSLEKDTVMFFDFKEIAKHGIWMLNMRFPIDTIWVSEKLGIVDLINDISEASGMRVYRPAKDARYLIEANAGFINKNKIKKEKKLK